jgi:hypothetical protein
VDGEGDRVARARVHFDRLVVALAGQTQLRVEGVVLQVRDDDPLELRAEDLDQGRHEVVRHRARRLPVPDAAVDRPGLEHPDDDRELALAVLLLQVDALLVARLADDDAREVHLDHGCQHSALPQKGLTA